jgi:membrane-associated protein
MAEWLSRLEDLGSLPPVAVYVVLTALVFVESGLLVGFFLPGDTVLFAAGLLAAAPGSRLSLPLLAGLVFAAAVAGDGVAYWTGHRFGRPWLLRRAGPAAARVKQAERFYARFGWWAVVIARFIPWVRTVTPIVAGVARMPYRRFLSANVAGAACWGSGLIVLGYVSFQITWLRQGAYAVAAVAVAGSVIGAAIGVYRSRSARPKAAT